MFLVLRLALSEDGGTLENGGIGIQLDQEVRLAERVTVHLQFYFLNIHFRISKIQ